MQNPNQNPATLPATLPVAPKAPAPKATKATKAPATKAPKAPATKPAPKAPAPKAAKPAKADAATIASRGLAHDAATITRAATNFEQYSDRDSAYLRFFGSVMRKHDNTATLAQIHAAGKPGERGKSSNPFYTGSAKATDAGAINRLVKAGYLRASDNGNTLTATPLALAAKLYTGKTA